MIWTLLAAITLILLVLEIAGEWFKNSRKRKLDNLRDSEDLRKALLKWEPLVLYRCKTLRGVKFFANRVRLICARHKSLAESIISDKELIVAFSALVECGDIGANAEFNTNEHYDEYKRRLKDRLKAELSKDKKELTQQIASILDETSKGYWDDYKKLAAGVRFPDLSP